ncbi:MAG: hypothetical protein VB133_09525 [Anaeromusa sp.]|uniref:hypothetical protein n=1 Tax=Anaeromusa sp. TaxID=1872520 RepID=UPI002B1FE3D0|nr:hypothetical protein [Anaeromusa sp.]MEA4835363.1 hypothetical protein [Anaeromusa sp.]
MKIVVTEAFFDKNTGEPYNRGEIFESDDKKRIKELRAGGYLASDAVEEVPESSEEKPDAEQTDQPPAETPPAE